MSRVDFGYRPCPRCGYERAEEAVDITVKYVYCPTCGYDDRKKLMSPEDYENYMSMNNSIHDDYDN
jgi:uncharacterized protein (UPF0212 family)